MSEKAKPRISRLIVGLGKTTRSNAQEVWQRRYFELEFEFSEAPKADEFELARKAALETIEGWLNEKAMEPPKPNLLSVEAIEKLPWKNYQTKELVEPGHTGWILWERDGGFELAKALREAPEQKLKIGPYEITFSGKDRQFLSRKVVEPIPEAPAQ